MSGGKRITVDESAWIRLQKQAGQLKQIQRDIPTLVESVRRQTRTDLERVSAQLETRQNTVEQTVQTLSEQTRKLETDTNRRLHEATRRLKDSLEQTEQRVRGEMRGALAEQGHELRAELSELRQRGREEMRRVAEQVGELLKHHQRAAETAQLWISDARAMHDLIGNEMPHERHAPGQLAALERLLVTAEQNADEGNSQSAISTAQMGYHELSELRVEVELREREWQLARAAAVEALAVVQGLIKNNASRDVQDENGNQIPGVTLDVDHWTGGELSQLNQDVAASLVQVRDDGQPMPTEQLRRIAMQEAPAFEQRLAEVVERAGVRQLASQLRVNVADVVVQTLEEVAGYELVDSTYVGADQRQAFLAKLAHQNRNEIVVDVGPSAEDSGRFVLRVLSYDSDTAAEADLVERARAVAAGLRAQGLTVQEPETEPGRPDESQRDFDTLRRPLPQTVVERSN